MNLAKRIEQWLSHDPYLTMRVRDGSTFSTNNVEFVYGTEPDARGDVVLVFLPKLTVSE